MATTPPIDLIVEPCGNVRMIYDESIDPRVIGVPRIRRGSHVEPTENGHWTADLSPCGGPVLGPFSQRSQAIDAEIDWLRKHWIGSSSADQCNPPQ
ncbi:MAG: hypothetical protein ACO1RT_06210 [Planctomycetaceae bacterium]